MTEPIETYCRPEVRAFARLMEERLRENDHKRGWQDNLPHALLRRLRQETDELEAAMPWRTGRRKWQEDLRMAIEAADVANFAMMIADVSRALERER